MLFLASMSALRLPLRLLTRVRGARLFVIGMIMLVVSGASLAQTAQKLAMHQQTSGAVNASSDEQFQAHSPQDPGEIVEQSQADVADGVEQSQSGQAGGTGHSLGSTHTEQVTLRIKLSDALEQGGSRIVIPLMLRRLDSGARDRMITLKADEPSVVMVAPGRYQLALTRPIALNGTTYVWDLELPLAEPANEVVLSGANAVVAYAQAAPRQTPTVTSADVSKQPVPLSSSSENRILKRKPSALVSEANNLAQFAKRAPAKSSAPHEYSPAMVTVINVTAPPLTDRPNERPVTPAPPGSAGELTPAGQEQAQREIEGLLKRWNESMKNRDLEALMSCYAPQMSTYFRKHDVTWDEVKRDKEHFFHRYSEVRQLDIGDVRFEKNAQGLEATLRKTWDFGGSRDFRGEVVTRLTFENVRGRWLISAERERLLWEDKSPVAVASR